MPVIHNRAQALDTRHPHNVVELDARSRATQDLNPTVIGFLIPLFVVLLVGPFLCVYFTRHRRVNQMVPTLQLKSPLERNEEAKKKLQAVTEISNVAGEERIRRTSIGDDKASADNVLILEKDCAICLSSLYSPSPPEPAQLSREGTTPAKASSMSDLSSSAQEEILRLKVCGHQYHSECLISWFLIRKYSCPICRAVYYGKDAGRRASEEEVDRRDRDERRTQREQV